MGPGVEQAVGLELAVDFDQRFGQTFQQPDRNRLVVDEAAAAPIGGDAAADDQRRRRPASPARPG